MSYLLIHVLFADFLIQLWTIWTPTSYSTSSQPDIHCQFCVKKIIRDVEVLNYDKKLAMDDGDTRDGTEEKTQNDSDTGSDGWKWDLINVDVYYEREEKGVKYAGR